ncbi:MAG TPA: DUF4352 domain-containing protein [Micromonosporaceae bacterium]
MRNKMVIAGLAIMGAFVLGCGAGTDDSAGGSVSGNSNAGGDDQKAAKIGEPARDGKFEFTVSKIKCGVAKVGSDFLEEKAQGQYCLVTVNVKNIGKEAQYFSDSDQKAYSSDGTEYSTDSAAGLVANKDADTIFNQINPGNQVTGILVYDIPKDVTLTKLELHDSAFSDGVTVELG